MTDMRNKASFNAICNRMKKKGLIVYPDSKTVQMTHQGLPEVGPEIASLSQTNKAVQDREKETTKRSKCREMFEVLADGKVHSVKECAELFDVHVRKSIDPVIRPTGQL